jgi:hypothetical protein
MIIFHGGCEGCTQQKTHSTDFCYDCRYFDAEWHKPNLNNSSADAVELERRRVKAQRERTRE